MSLGAQCDSRLVLLKSKEAGWTTTEYLWAGGKSGFELGQQAAYAFVLGEHYSLIASGSRWRYFGSAR
jgi:hypothetical protein